jgi:hypothetical protein
MKRRKVRPIYSINGAIYDKIKSVERRANSELEQRIKDVVPYLACSNRFDITDFRAQ